MYKTLITLLLLFITSCAAQSVTAQDLAPIKTQPIRCSPTLKDVLSTILKLPEAAELVATIQSEGAFSIEVNQSPSMQNFQAYWDPDRRVISVNMSRSESKGDTMASILFEMHNALANRDIDRLYTMAQQGRINRDAYVEAMEYLEYQNSINASKLAEKGVKKGLYPSSCRLMTYSSFEQHFHIQKIYGHSAWFARTYDEAAPNRFGRRPS